MKSGAVWMGAAAVSAGLLLSGCSRAGGGQTVAEGVIYSAEFVNEGGSTYGITRANDSRAVPGGSGSWNEDAYGRLTPDFLLITRPRNKELGPQVIPARRLVSIQFGDGGIKKVNGN